jgi:3' terminal RNA ribose 2'-O-methyltransferase Hen1
MDMGCGEGKLLRMLLNERKFERILGMDISWKSLEIAKERLHFERLSERDKNRIQLIQGALTYRDQRLAGFDAAVLIEVIEHVDADRLPALERSVFEFATPQYVIVTTPNKDWNITFTEDTNLMRHKDHRFEWTRAEFADWCQKIQGKFSYSFTIKSVGEETETNGAPSQMAIFKKENA